MIRSCHRSQVLVEVQGWFMINRNLKNFTNLINKTQLVLFTTLEIKLLSMPELSVIEGSF